MVASAFITPFTPEPPAITVVYRWHDLLKIRGTFFFPFRKKAKEAQEKARKVNSNEH